MKAYYNGQTVSVKLNGGRVSYMAECGAEYYYVSLGDSIAVGHSINAEWEKEYGYHTQYGENGNTTTKIVANSYTDLISKYLRGVYGNKFWVKSYAHSGDTVADLIKKLDHTAVINSIKNANLVTVCIGANDVLQPALNKIGDYINTGNPALVTLGETVQANIDILNNDANANSYTALFNKLKGINPNAMYVFTTIYNPLKYLWIDYSTHNNDYKDGFFGPLMWAIPETVGDASNIVREKLYNTSVVQTVFDRINGPSRDGSDSLAAWTETYITKLNQVLKDKISVFGNSNFIIADTKALYDTFPDRPITADTHYNDLVNIEFTRGFVVEDMDWAQFWGNVNWLDVTANILTFDFNNLMTDVVTNIVNNVIVPDIDPHPETYGHYALYRSFADVLDWASLTRYSITFETTTGGTGSMQKQELVTIDNLTAYTNIKEVTFTPTGGEGNHFSSWNTQENGSGSSYPDKGLIGITSNITLYAQWNIMYNLTLICEAGADILTGSGNDTGAMEYRMCFVGGNNVLSNKNFRDFGNNPDKLSLAYGTKIGVVVRIVSDAPNGDNVDPVIYANGAPANKYKIDESYMPNAYGFEFIITSDTEIRFVWYDWRVGGNNSLGDAYWDCFITTQNGEVLPEQPEHPEQPETSQDGLFDENGELLATWSTLTDTYGMDCKRNYTSETYKTSTTSPYYVLTNYSRLANGRKLIIGDSVTSIGNHAFAYCSSLTSVTIGVSVTSIGQNAFSSCSSLTSIEILDSVTYIGSSAFSGCSSLTSVTMGNGVTSIGQNAFYGCNSLQYNEKDGLKYLGNDTNKYLCLVAPISTNITTANIDNNCKVIVKYMFEDCTSLVSMTIPFVGEKKDGTSNTHFGYLFGASSNKYNEKYVPASLKTVTITGGIIDEYAFYHCTSLTSITIGENVTSIVGYAFRGCTSLSSVTIGDGVTDIGQLAFAGCSSLTSITIPANVTTMGSRVFENCSSLTNIIVDENNPNYKSIDGNLYSKDGKTILKYAEGKPATSFTIPNTVTSIAEFAFASRGALISIVVPTSITSIGYYAFNGCYSLTRVDFSAFTRVPSLGNYNFSHSPDNLQIKVPASLIDSWKSATNWSKLADKIVTEFTN